jgi:hypothetical protein
MLLCRMLRRRWEEAVRPFFNDIEEMRHYEVTYVVVNNDIKTQSCFIYLRCLFVLAFNFV